MYKKRPSTFPAKHLRLKPTINITKKAAHTHTHYLNVIEKPRRESTKRIEKTKEKNEQFWLQLDGSSVFQRTKAIYPY